MTGNEDDWRYRSRLVTRLLLHSNLEHGPKTPSWVLRIISLLEQEGCDIPEPGRFGHFPPTDHAIYANRKMEGCQ